MDPEKVGKLWDKNSSAWLDASNKGYDIWRDHMNTPAFLKMLPDVTQLSGLDIGCGDAYNTRLIAARCKQLTAIDLSDKFLQHNRQVTDSSNIYFQKMNAACLEYPNEYFDFVVSTMAFMDAPDLEKILAEAYRVLSPTGFLQFSILHPCFNEHKGLWITDSDGKRIHFAMKDYFKECSGDIHEWKHPVSPVETPNFCVPRFSKPLSKWITLLIDAGFLIEAISEPFADSEVMEKYPELISTHIVAHSLIIRVKKNENYKETFRKIIEKLPGNVWWKNNNLKYLGCNDGVISMLGLNSRNDFIGKTDFDLFEKKIAEKLYAADTHILKTGETINLEEVITQADGSKVVMLTNKSPLYDDYGKIVAIVGTSTNINDRKKMEEELNKAKQAAEEASNIKTDFIKSMSHDIKNPLRGIISSAHRLSENAKSPEDKEEFNIIYNSSNVLLKFLTGILDAAKLGFLRENIIHEETFDLRECIQDILNLEKPHARNKGLDLILEIDHSLPHFVVSDREKLMRSIINLIGNSIKFTQTGCIKIKVKLEKNVNKKANISFSIMDTGIGIPKDKQDKVFEQFYRVVPVYEKRQEGHGLGLSIVQKFIHLLGGTITLTSELGQGTTVQFVLSMNVGKEEEARKSFSSEENDFPIAENKLAIKKENPNLPRALAIEDDPGCMRAAHGILEKLGYAVTEAVNAESALQHFKSEKYDFILTDIGLPGMSGDELVVLMRHIEKIKKVEKPIPIIALTGHASDNEMKTLLLSSGVDLVIDKAASEKATISAIQHFMHPTKQNYVIQEENDLVLELPKTEEALFQLEKFPICDLERAKTQRSDEKEIFVLLEIILKGIPAGISELQAAHDEKNWEKVAKIAHRMKGPAAFCLTKMAFACCYLERYYKTGQTQFLERLYQQVISVLGETKTIILKDHER